MNETLSPAARVLVTGGAGFIGATVVRALQELGREVVVLDSGTAAGVANVDGIGATVVRADLMDRESVDRALEGCSSVVHLAAQTSVPLSISEPIADFHVNVIGSLALLEAVRRSDVARFIFASSSAVIGGHPPPAHEALTPLPVSPYGAAKAAIEAYLVAYQRAYGLETVALRFANVYGPWSAHKSSVVAAFVKAYQLGGPLVIRGTGEQTRDLVHVDDISAAIVACLDAPGKAIAGEVLQVGSGRETSLNDLASLLFEVGGHEVEIERQPAAAGDVPRSVSDLSRARSVIGYEPQVDLRTGLRRTLEWFGDHWRP